MNSCAISSGCLIAQGSPVTQTEVLAERHSAASKIHGPCTPIERAGINTEAGSHVGLFHRHVRALEVHFKFGSHGRAQAVEELAEVQAAGVVLKIARIEMVCDIENRGPGAHTLVEKGDLEAFQDLHIERHKGWKASSLVAPADEI